MARTIAEIILMKALNTHVDDRHFGVQMGNGSARELQNGVYLWKMCATESLTVPMVQTKVKVVIWMNAAIREVCAPMDANKHLR